MTLSLNYNSLTAGIINYLKANSTTVDNGLYSSVTGIFEFRPDEYVLYANKFPAVSVDLLSHDEERMELGMGSNARRKITCNWGIGCHIRNIASYSATYQNMRTLVTNVELALRNDDRLSATFDLVQINTVNFGNLVGSPGRFEKNGLINLQTVNFIQ